MFCKNCGTEYEGNFCPSCGTSVEAPVVEAPVENECANTAACCAPAAKASNGGLAKAMNIVSKSLAFFGAAMALILICFLGIEYMVEYNGMSQAEPIAKNIFYFWGENLKELSDILDAEELSGAVLLATVLKVLLPFFLSLAVLVLVIVFGIIAIVKFAKSFSQDNDTVKASLKAMLVYVLGAAVLSVLYVNSFKEDGDVEKIKLNGATITGLVFCTIAIVGTVVCKLIEKPSNFKCKSFLANKIVGLIAVIIGMVALILAANTGVSYKSSYGGTTTIDGFAATIRFDTPAGLIAEIFMVLAVIFFVFALFRNIKKVITKEADSAMAFSIVALIFAMIGSIILCVIDAKIKNDSMGRYTPNMVGPIVLIVFSLLNLGTAIAGNIVANKTQIED